MGREKAAPLSPCNLRAQNGLGVAPLPRREALGHREGRPQGDGDTAATLGLSCLCRALGSWPVRRLSQQEQVSLTGRQQEGGRQPGIGGGWVPGATSVAASLTWGKCRYVSEHQSPHL